MTENLLSLNAIGVIHSPFKEKFGLPRQASLIKSCTAEIELYAPYNTEDYVKGLDDFSDIWLIFGFHKNKQQKKRALVRPPRLGGNKKVGVFASRSPFRPNGLGISRVELIAINNSNNKVGLTISCPDMVDGTPIYDIKPYIHYSDSNENAKCAFAQEKPENTLNVEFSKEALCKLSMLNPAHYPKLKQTLIEVLAQNPCPAYKDLEPLKRYGMKLYDLNITWIQEKSNATILNIEKIK